MIEVLHHTEEQFIWQLLESFRGVILGLLRAKAIGRMGLSQSGEQTCGHRLVLFLFFRLANAQNSALILEVVMADLHLIICVWISSLPVGLL